MPVRRWGNLGVVVTDVVPIDCGETQRRWKVFLLNLLFVDAEYDRSFKNWDTCISCVYIYICIHRYCTGLAFVS